MIESILIVKLIINYENNKLRNIILYTQNFRFCQLENLQNQINMIEYFYE